MSVKLITVMALALTAATCAANGELVTVTISSDDVDIDWQTGTIDDLPGPDGEVSFAEAIVATNNTPGHQTIGFAIPESDWQLQFAYPGRAVIMGGNLRSFDELTVDGRTQTEFTGDTNPDGWEVAIYGATLYLNGDNSTLYGLDSSPVQVTGANALVEGNTEMNITVYDGGGSTIKGNTAGTIKIDRSNDNLVVGNTAQRVRVWGFGGGQQSLNNRIGGPEDDDRNYLTGYGTWNGEGLPSGSTVQLFDTRGTIVENNWIGTTPDGLSQGNLACTMGFEITGANDDLIIRGNRIAGILGHGHGPHHAGQLFGWAVYMTGSGSGISILGNTIGLNALDEPALGSVTGIDIGSFYFDGATDIRIGGRETGEGNVIAGHLFNGITIGRDVAEARISGNSIYSNDDLGIDLVPTGYGYGVTANDPLDGDTGGNGLQNFPVLEMGTIEQGLLHVVGTLDSSPSTSFSVEFFASPECDDSGFGEGQVFVGAVEVATDANGSADLDVMLDAQVDEGWVLTATATREPIGATSEFSQCIGIETGPAAVTDEQHAAADGLPALLQSHPNPFETVTSIEFVLHREGTVHLAIYDASGRLVRALVDDSEAAGSREVTWDGRSDQGAKVAAGVYFCQLRAAGRTITRQLLLTR